MSPFAEMAHGIDELSHQELGIVVVRSKSYGRAPTFLMATRYEQARSVVAEIAGDRGTAREVRLVLPETGVCSAPNVKASASSSCGGPAREGADACGADDVVAKEKGEAGCDCSKKPVAPVAASACCRSAA
jgi:hypothetical protein